jgi:4-hydroxybenzoate polyprenyltransferase
MAPLGAWLAITGDVSIEPFLLWLAVALWIGGFDIIYATADVEFDRREGLHSLPSRFGIAPALMVTRVAHLLAISLLIVVGVSLGVGPFYYAGLAVVAALLGYENSIVHADDLSRVNVAFFTLNGVISMVFLAGVLADALT